VNDLHIFSGRPYPAFALFLEAMQHKDGFFELDGVDSTVRPSRIVFNHLQNSRASESLQDLGCVMLLAILGKVQGVTEELPHYNRQSHQVPFAAPNPEQRFFGGKHNLIIPEQV
jgi:hypothetical protein